MAMTPLATSILGSEGATGAADLTDSVHPPHTPQSLQPSPPPPQATRSPLAPPVPPAPAAITGLILAGGRARRMGGEDKGLIPLAGRPLIAWVIDALAPQVGRILISANRNQAAYAAFGHPVIGDEAVGAELAGFQGPLAGIAAAMTRMETPWLLTLPCDAPLAPADLASRLAAALVHGPDGLGGMAGSGNLADIAGAHGDRAQSTTSPTNNPLTNKPLTNTVHSTSTLSDLAVAWDGVRRQPIHALLSRALLPDLLANLAAGERRLDAWQAHHHPAIADFSDCPEAFLNLNAPEDIRRLEHLLPATRTGFLAASQIAPDRPSRPMPLS